MNTIIPQVHDIDDTSFVVIVINYFFYVEVRI